VVIQTPFKFEEGYTGELGPRCLRSIVFRRGSSASGGIPLAARVRLTVLYTRSIVCREPPDSRFLVGDCAWQGILE
jgi:hypothetical protein